MCHLSGIFVSGKYLILTCRVPVADCFFFICMYSNVGLYVGHRSRAVGHMQCHRHLFVHRHILIMGNVFVSAPGDIVDCIQFI